MDLSIVEQESLWKQTGNTITQSWAGGPCFFPRSQEADAYTGICRSKECLLYTEIILDCSSMLTMKKEEKRHSFYVLCCIACSRVRSKNQERRMRETEGWDASCQFYSELIVTVKHGHMSSLSTMIKGLLFILKTELLKNY